MKLATSRCSKPLEARMSPIAIFRVILVVASFDTAAIALECDGFGVHSCGGAVNSDDDACFHFGECDSGLSLLQANAFLQKASAHSQMTSEEIFQKQFEETLRSLPSDLTVKQVLAQEENRVGTMVKSQKSSTTTTKKNPITGWVAALNGMGSFLLLILGAALAKGRYDKCMGEFLGTFILVLTVGCNVILNNSTWGVTSIAFSLMVAVYAIAPISGANFNPAVSVALGLNKLMGHVDGTGLECREIASYICCQLSGGMFAGVAYSLLLGNTLTFGPLHKHSLISACVAEMIYTFLIVFVVLNTACSREHAGKNQFYSLAIASAVIAGGYGAGSISGGCFNPAVAWGLACSGYHTDFLIFLAYLGFELLGCILAVSLFKGVRPEDFGKPLTGGTKLLAELLGPYFIVLTVGLNVTSGSTAGAYSIAASVIAMTFALGSVSGAHFNPAVTLAILFGRRDYIDLRSAISYMLIQILGGIAGGFTSLGLMGKAVALEPGHKATISQALLGEFVFTFLLAYVVLSVTTVRDDKKLTQMYGLAIGGCIVAGGFAIGPLSGASLNPAVSAGLAISDLVKPKDPILNFLSYAGVELAGGILAAITFLYTHQKVAYDELDKK